MFNILSKLLDLVRLLFHCQTFYGNTKNVSLITSQISFLVSVFVELVSVTLYVHNFHNNMECKDELPVKLFNILWRENLTIALTNCQVHFRAGMQNIYLKQARTFGDQNHTAYMQILIFPSDLSWL